VEVAGAPEIPAGNGAEGAPFFSAAGHLFGGGEVGLGDDAFASEGSGGEGVFALEGEVEAFADSVIGDGEDVGTAEAEHEEHFDGPAADAADFDQAGDDVVVAHAADALQGGDGPVEGFGGEVAEGEEFVAGEAGGAELFVGRVEQGLGRGVESAGDLKDAAEDGGGGAAVELLVDDGFEERFKGGVGGFEAEGEGAGAADEFAELGVRGGEGADGGGRVVARDAASVGHDRNSLTEGE
jgi:hypothetical protein